MIRVIRGRPFRFARVKRRFFGKGLRWNFDGGHSVVSHSHEAVACDAADLCAWHIPFVEHFPNNTFPSALGNDQHPFLGFAQHDFIRRHARLPFWNFGQINFDSAAATAGCFAR